MIYLLWCRHGRLIEVRKCSCAGYLKHKVFFKPSEHGLSVDKQIVDYSETARPHRLLGMTSLPHMCVYALHVARARTYVFTWSDSVASWSNRCFDLDCEEQIALLVDEWVHRTDLLDPRTSANEYWYLGKHRTMCILSDCTTRASMFSGYLDPKVSVVCEANISDLFTD